MEALLLNYGVEWLNLLVRWLHLITGIAWIGASFYFVWLDNSIRPPRPGSDLEKAGVAGELWAVHGGGFYNPQKYLVAPKQLPDELHWFKWEAYSTWLSGFALLCLVYYVNPSAMMIDRAVADLTPLQAVGIGIGTLVIGWTVYDLLCKSPLGQRDGLLGIVMYLLIVAAAWALARLLGGRAAYIHVGAMIGTIMVANVLMQIIPGQRKMVEAMKAGKSPDPIYGKRAKQRSVHNNYFTLPVLFIMISNHYAMTYNHPYNWLILAGIMAAGVLIRHFFNLRHKGRIAIGYPAAGMALLLVVAVAIAPKPAARGGGAAVDMAQVQAVVEQRCVSCHADQPTHPGFAAAPSGVMLQTPELLKQHAERVYRQVVQLKSMPIGNLTNMTEEERALIARWYEAGAK
ncbi:MAG TPA: urate hydroxylase PuuD [Noviherbaspirillum sp.]|uniref:urate hydroxylase PuuD n=1 Tax=Noviherbaspirillum sp. TaxID=1926288 RepID=UPI002D49F790|nr:urate hydroxylase PuuD [Noviherbaspirillum sp.]HYD93834.1 urate hydroxylase PuuD [Noviherbaspirillum sp.]